MASSMTLAYNSYKSKAREIKDYENKTITDLANGYCEAIDNNNKSEQDKYFAGLILKFWYKIPKAYQKNKAALKVSIEECYDWVVGAIMQACDKDARIWQKNPAISAQQAINQVFSTRFERAAYYESNLLKNKGNHLVTSLDEPIGDEEDGNTIGDLISDDSSEIDKDGDVGYFVQSLLRKNRIVEAIIVDNIVDPDKDVFKYSKKVIKETNDQGEQIKYTKCNSEFWSFKLIRELNELDSNYINYFLSKYNVSKEAFLATMNVIRKANNQKKYRMLRATIKSLQKDFAKYYIS